MEKPEIIWEDSNYVAVNKPSGWLSIPDRFDANKPNILGFLNKLYPKVYVIHRIDKDTSGLILFAKNAEAHQWANDQFSSHSVCKKYLTLVIGRTPEEGEINFKITEDPIHAGRMMCHHKYGKESLTIYKTIANYACGMSLLEVEPKTGRTHQIRVHCLTAGFPLVIDPFYGGEEGIFLSAIKRKFKLSVNQEQENPLMNRLTLHASSLEFIPLGSTSPIKIEAPLTKDFRAVVQQLNKWSIK